MGMLAAVQNIRKVDSYIIASILATYQAEVDVHYKYDIIAGMELT